MTALGRKRTFGWAKIR